MKQFTKYGFRSEAEFRGFRQMLDRFATGMENSYNSGSWRIAVGRYDLYWEISYKEQPVFSCVSGEIRCAAPEVLENKGYNVQAIHALVCDCLSRKF